MATYQGKSGKRGSQTINPSEAGIVAAVVYEFDLSTQGLAANDILEMGPLPARAFVSSVTVIGEGVGAITADVSLMTGEPGNPDPTRTLVGGTSQVLTAASINSTEATATRMACKNVPQSNYDRAWGVKVSGIIAAGAGKKITLIPHFYY